jgi:hypothetical protein
MTIWPAKPHRTAESRLDAPAPSTAEEMTCVVLIGAPNRVAISMTAAEDVWNFEARCGQ